MKRAILMTILAMGLIGGLVGGGLFAFFSDTETSTGNTFEAGTVQLDVDWNVPIGAPVEVEAKPCNWVRLELDHLTNVGRNPGKLWMHITCPEDDPAYWQGGEFPDAEYEAGDTTNACNLQDYLEIIILDTPDDVLSIVQGCSNFGEAWDALSVDYLPHLMWGGLLKDFHCLWKGPFDLYPQQEMDIQIIVHLQDIPNANIMQGDKAVFDKTYYLEQFPCNGGPSGGKEIKLPSDFVYVNLHHPGSGTDPWGHSFMSYWTAKLSGIPAGDYDVENFSDTGAVYACWCLDEQHLINNNQTWQVKMVSSLDPSIYTLNIDWGLDYLPGQNPDVPLFNYINYLINANDATSAGESALQHAVWAFIDGWEYDDLNATEKAMVDDAILNGSDFVPDDGEYALVIMYHPSGFQIVGIEVDP